MKTLVAETVAKRAAGEQASRPRAFVAAGVAAAGVGVVVYKLLRSGSDGEPDS